MQHSKVQMWNVFTMGTDVAIRECFISVARDTKCNRTVAIYRMVGALAATGVHLALRCGLGRTRSQPCKGNFVRNVTQGDGYTRL
jgi:hypothetical protein